MIIGAEKKKVDLNCDICGSPMLMSTYPTAILFECSNCKQTHDFTSFDHGRTILGKMFPSIPIDEMSKQMKGEYVKYWYEDNKFSLKAQLFGNLITQEEYDRHMQEMNVAIEKFWVVHGEKVEPIRSLWQKIRMARKETK